MALFQPTNIFPDALGGAGNGTIDASQALNVSWQVNGNSPMIAYQIKIMQNDSASTVLLNTGKTVLSEPFYGVDFRGVEQMFSVAISAADMATAGIVNGYANGYKMEITQWWGNSDYVEQTNPSYFITRSNPTLVITSNPQQMGFTEYLFVANYSQAQGDPVEWMRWELEVEPNNPPTGWIKLDDTGRIYNAGEIRYYYDGFAPNYMYRIRVTVQTVNGIEISTNWMEFGSIGRVPAMIGPNVCALCETDAVRIMMPKNFPILGAPNGTYHYNTVGAYQTLTIESGSSIRWGAQSNYPYYETDQELDIDPMNGTFVIRGSVGPVSGTKDVFTWHTMGYDLTLSYDENGFFVHVPGYATKYWETDGLSVSEDDVFSFAFKNGSVYFNLIHNSQNNYSAGQMQLHLVENKIQALTLYGENTFYYVWFTTQLISDEDLEALLTRTALYSVVYQEGTEFMLHFHGTLYTGPIIMEDGLERIAIYRKDKSGVSTHIADNYMDKNFQILDYSATSQTEYDYYFALVDEEDYYAVSYERGYSEDSHIKPIWWNYTVICCSVAEDGRYVKEKEYRFSLDVNSGNSSNNNSPAFQKNFTQYPNRQPVTSNYRSGTLSAFIGKAQDYEYVDSVSLMHELYDLSVDESPKFLKTRKGEIFKIETSAPVSMQIGDKYVPQPAKISLPWAEVGESKNAIIVDTPGTIYAGGLPMFHADAATMEITMEYNPNSQMGANSFAISNGDIYLNEPGQYDAQNFYLNGNKEVILRAD